MRLVAIIFSSADVFHTFFGLAGLSLLGHLGESGAEHAPIDPVYALPLELTLKLKLPRQILPEAGAST
jgi:geranylgeranyl transferase type-2 subunit beta